MTNISSAELKKRMDNNEHVNLLDVREPDERAEFNIGGHFIPLGQVTAMQVDEIEDLKDEELIVYCRGGVRSAKAALFLETMGFTNVRNLEGGMTEWQRQQAAS